MLYVSMKAHIVHMTLMPSITVYSVTYTVFIVIISVLTPQGFLFVSTWLAMGWQVACVFRCSDASR